MKKFSRTGGAVALTLLCLIGSAGAQTVADVVAGVSETSYRNFLDNKLYTRTGHNRGFGAQHDLAREEIRSTMAGYGLTTSLHGFSYNSSTYYNVVGFKQGTTRPDEFYVVGAHYDSVNNPGADDNASGTAGVLEAARVLTQYTFEASIYFIAFDREEQGLVGSDAWVTDHSGLDFRGMIALDMIGYNPAGATVDRAMVYGRSTSASVKSAVAQAIADYSGGIAPTIGGNLPYSDHASFESKGFGAALLIEYESGSNPYYHSQLDSVDTANYIDYDYATGMTRGAVGYVATAAGLTPVPEPATIAVCLFGLAAVARRRRSN